MFHFNILKSLMISFLLVNYYSQKRRHVKTNISNYQNFILKILQDFLSLNEEDKNRKHDMKVQYLIVGFVHIVPVH